MQLKEQGVDVSRILVCGGRCSMTPLIFRQRTTSMSPYACAHSRPSMTPSAHAPLPALQIISLSVGEPDFDTPASIVQAGVEALSKGQTRYTPNAGSTVLRKAICKKLLGAWLQHHSALMICLYATANSHVIHTYGSHVILPSPSFPVRGKRVDLPAR